MTIGPDPRTRMRRMSSLRGNEPLQKAIEEMQRVVGSRAGLRVVLDGGGRHITQHEPLDRSVIEIQLLQLSRAEIRFPPDGFVRVDGALPARAEHREAVVLGGDLDL